MVGFCARNAAVVLLLLVPATGCAPTVAFQQIQPGCFGAGRDLGLSVTTTDFEVNLDVVGLRELAAVRKKNQQAQGAPSDLEQFGPWVEREALRNIIADSALRLSTSITHTLAVSAALYVRDTTTVNKEEIKLENRIVDVRETSVVDRLFELTLNYRIISASTGTVTFSGKQDGVRSQKGAAKTAEEAVQRFDPWDGVLESLIAQEAKKMMIKILPRAVMVKRTLRSGSSKSLRGSVEIAEKEGLDRAWPLWLAILDSGETLAPQDRAAVLHNIGVYYESKDDLANARSAYEQCLSASREDWCAEGRARVRTRASELEAAR